MTPLDTLIAAVHLRDRSTRPRYKATAADAVLRATFEQVLAKVRQESGDWERLARQSGEKHVSVSEKLTLALDRVGILEEDLREAQAVARLPLDPERTKKVARSFAQEWLRPNDPDHATPVLVDTLSTVMLAFVAVVVRAPHGEQP